MNRSPSPPRRPAPSDNGAATPGRDVARPHPTAARTLAYRFAKRPLLAAARLATAHRRTLPNAIILGAQKAGTTSLLEHLAKHPLVFPAAVKEPHFFDARLRWRRRYRAHFPRIEHIERAAAAFDDASRADADAPSPAPSPPPTPIVIEATPYYLAHPACPRRIAAALPAVRCIAVLREPAARALSHYHHNRRLGLEPLPSFDDALHAEPHRLHDLDRRLERARFARSPAHQHWSYALRGHYAEQLERFAGRLGRDRLLVLFAEELFHDPDAATRRVERHLHLPPFHDYAPFPRSNAAPSPPPSSTSEPTAPSAAPAPSAPSAAPADADRDALQQLRDAFAAPNRQLADWLGRDLPPSWPR